MFVLAFSTPPKGLAEGLTPEEYGTRNTNVPSIQWTAKNKEREAPETAFLGPLVLFAMLHADGLLRPRADWSVSAGSGITCTACEHEVKQLRGAARAC